MHKSFFTFAILLVMLSRTAGAAPRDSEARREAYRQGYAALQSKNWEEAYRILALLWAEQQSYDVALSLGQAEIRLGKFRDAAEHLTFALEHIPPAEAADLVERVKKALALAKAEVGAFVLVVDQPGAAVRLDGNAVGTTPVASELFVDPGKHVIEVSLAGFSTVRKEIEPRAGEASSVVLKLEPVPSAAAPSPAPTESPAPPPPAESGKSLVPVYVAGGVATVGLTLGIVFTIAAGSTGDDIDTLRQEVGTGGCAGATPPPQCVELTDALEKKDGQRNASYASFAIAGAALVGGAVYLLWPSAPASTKVSVHWLPAAGPMITVAGTL